MVRVEELDRIDDDDDELYVRPAALEQQEQEDASPDGEVASAVPLVDSDEIARLREEYQPTPLEKFMAIAKSLLLRAMVVYFVMSFIRGNSGPAKTATTGADGEQKVNLGQAENAFPNGTAFDLYVYLNERNDIVDFANDRLIWKQEGLIYGDWFEGTGGLISMTTDVELSEKVRLRNGSIYVHTYIVPIGNDPGSLSNKLRVYSTRMVNKFKKRKYAKTKNLITGETSASQEDQEKSTRMDSEIVSHWHNNLTINIVSDWTVWTIGAVPAPLNEYVKFLPKDKKYLPVLFYNDYWNLLKDYQPISAANKTVSMTLTYQPLSLFKWQLYAAQTMRNQWNLMATDEDEDQDTLKEAMIETNPYLLGLTFVVSILHSVFEFFAFKNDIQFWNNRKSLEGLSVRSVFFNVFQSLIVLLYVLDNETNFVIRVSVFVGLAIEIWKINKVTDISISHENKWFGLIPRLQIQDKGSYTESETKKFDRMAFRYLSWLCFPLIICYSAYSLIYHEHKGIYSFILSLCYGFLLTFGFIMMTPQLFINYKMKSVAHLPWRMLTYKFLNTFIDDIFAFVIKMPTMYRIGCLRDDVIFFVYLYQKWIYPVDKKRVNEFGFCGDEAAVDKTNGEVVAQKTVSDKKKD